MSSLYAPGTMIPGSVYLVTDIIAVGGTSIIYNVRDTVLDVRRAVKMLDHRRGAGLGQRILREWQVLARLDHPHIVRVYAANRTADEHQLPYYVMDWLEGQDLRRWIGTVGRFGVERAISIAMDVLSGLAAAHDRGVLHRDIKPENIFLRRAPRSPWYETKLLDFGCARLTDQPTSQGLVGTLNYVAPELLVGEEPTVRSDVYAVGVTLYEMLAGVHPFALVALARRDTPPALPADVGAPDELQEVLADALSASPMRRVSSARHFAGRLGQVARQLADGMRANTTEHDVVLFEALPPSSTLRINAAMVVDTEVDPPSSRRF